MFQIQTVFSCGGMRILTLAQESCLPSTSQQKVQYALKTMLYSVWIVEKNKVELTVNGTRNLIGSQVIYIVQ